MQNISEPMNMNNRATVTFHTSPEVKARLDVLASRTRRSKSFLTNEAVERYLAEEEDFIRDVEAGMADADAGRLYTTDEAREWLQAHIAGRTTKP